MKKAKILLVDDRPENLLALEGILRADDREILTAKNGQMALDLLMRHQFAIAILDVQMPGMTGLELAELMRGSDDTQRIPIIFVTAGVRDQETAFRGFEAGAVDFIFKPLNERIVRSKVKVFLDLAQQRALLEEKLLAIEASENQLRKSQLALAESNRQLEQFTSIASHDMKEPLRVIISYLSLLELRFGKNIEAEGKEFIANAISGARRLATLLDSLVQYSRVQRNGLELKTASCETLVKEVVDDLSSFIAERRATVTHPELPDITCDPSLLRQLFQNLISNGLKFNRSESPRVEISCETGRTNWTFTIADNGIGVPETEREKIFEPFVRCHNRNDFLGDGLGLSVCRTIVERHGGDIWVEPRSGGGSEFIFTLPMEKPE